MDLRRVAAVLPCDRLGDFPTHLAEPDASALLHNWTAAWRPELIAVSGRLPGAWSAYSPPDAETSAECVLIVPELSWTEDLKSWRNDLLESNGDDTILIDSLADRREIISALRQAGLAFTASGDRWQSEFYALGYAFLQVELLTHNLAYASVINTDELEEKIVQAAQAAAAGRDQEVEEGLRRVYDLLEQVRDHTYPAKNYLVDLVLLGDTTLDERLRLELAEPSPKTYVASASVCEAMQSSPLLPKLAEQCLAATHKADIDFAVLSPLPLKTATKQAFSVVESLTGKPPAAFVQLNPGLAPRLAALLSETETAMVLAPLEGSPPELGKVRSAIEAPGGAAVQSLATSPRPASQATTLLGIATRLSESLYREGVCTELFAAWAGCRHALFDDLRAVARRSSVLGAMVTLDDYLEQTQGLESTTFPPEEQLGPDWTPPARAAPVGNCEPYVETLAGIVECASGLTGKPPSTNPEYGPREMARALAQALVVEGDIKSRLVINAYSYARPVLIGNVGQHGLCDFATCELAADVPGLGYRVVSADATRKPGPRRVEATREGLQNELLELLLDDQTGGIRSLRQPLRRRNRLSQKLVVRREPGFLEVPTNVHIESVEVIANHHDRGVVAVTGELFDLKGGRLARFRQTAALLADWNRLFLDFELDTTEADTKLNRLSFASRFALPDTQYRWNRGVQATRLVTHSARFVSTDYVQASSGDQSITVASATPVRHLRHGSRMIDSLLPSQESGRSFCRFAIALDEPRPLRAALDLHAQAEPAAAAEYPGPPGGSGWIAHVDAANVLVLGLSALPEGESGARLTLVETMGRSTDVRLRLAREPQAAWRIDADGRRAGPLDNLGGALAIALRPHDQLTIEVTW